MSLGRHKKKQPGPQVQPSITIQEPLPCLDEKTEALVKGMVNGGKILSPVSGAVHKVVEYPNQKGLYFEDMFGISLTFPALHEEEVKTLVEENQVVQKGDALFEVKPSVLSKMTMDLMNPGLIPGYEDRKARILRIV